MTYAIACSTKWFREIEKSAQFKQYHFIYFSEKNDLTLENLKEVNPEYVFFPHWNWVVSDEIISSFECICFHTAPLPYGRGGSPVQNLIQRGYEKTFVSALKMTDALDAGPIYIQEEVSLLGGGDEIFLRISNVIQNLIIQIILCKPFPTEQIGEPTVFKRRVPSQSALPQSGDLKKLYDHIRMLDADGYPTAFVQYGDFIIEFNRATLRTNCVEANVVIRRKDTVCS